MQVSRQSLIVLGLGIFSLGILFFSFIQTHTQPVTPVPRKRFSMAEIVARTNTAKTPEQIASTEPVSPPPSVSAPPTVKKMEDLSEAESEASLKSRDGFSTAAETGDYALLQKILSDNDACAFGRYKFQYADLVRALVNTPDSVVVDSATDQTLLDLFDTDPSVSQTISTRNAQRDDINSFMNALYFSGQINGAKEADRDDAYALSLLETLASNDPDNAAYDYFTIVPMKRLGASDDEIKQRFRSMFQKPAFNIFWHQLDRRLYQKSLTDAAHSLAGILVRRTFPLPSLLPPKAILQDFQKQNDVQFNNESLTFARVMMKDVPTDDTRLKYGSLYWNSLEHAVGSSIGISGWPRGPTPNPFREAFNYGSELRKRMYALRDKDSEDFVSAFKPKVCDAARLQDFTERQKRTYLQDLPLLEK